MSANETQHGGSHYKAQYQHWDLVADLELNYYLANATKYMTRHRSKNGREDVLKAMHYLDKYLELIGQGRMPPPTDRPVLVQIARVETLNKFLDANRIEDEDEAVFFADAACASEMYHLQAARVRLDVILEKHYSAKSTVTVTVHAPEPTPVDVAAVLEPQFAPEGYWGDMRVLWKCKACGGYFQGLDGERPGDLHACPADPAEPTSAYVNQDR